jgi:hypothetical protein
MPNGTPVQNAQRHPPTSTSHAPSDGPDAVATDPTALQIDIANVRRVAGTASSSKATAAGPSIAPPIACTTRPAMSTDTFGDIAAVYRSDHERRKPDERDTAMPDPVGDDARRNQHRAVTIV